MCRSRMSDDLSSTEEHPCINVHGEYNHIPHTLRPLFNAISEDHPLTSGVITHIFALGQRANAHHFPGFGCVSLAHQHELSASL